MQKYDNLNSMLKKCTSARTFFFSLPRSVQTKTLENQEKIKDEDDLRNFADKIMHDFT